VQSFCATTECAADPAWVRNRRAARAIEDGPRRRWHGAGEFGAGGTRIDASVLGVADAVDIAAGCSRSGLELFVVDVASEDCLERGRSE